MISAAEAAAANRSQAKMLPTGKPERKISSINGWRYRVNPAINTGSTAGSLLDCASPRRIFHRIPAIGRHRFLISLTKYPAIAAIVCGSWVLWGRNTPVTDMERALSIISLIAGIYSILMWLFGQMNYHSSLVDAQRHELAKLVQLAGAIALYAGHTIVCVLAALELMRAGSLEALQFEPIPLPTENYTVVPDFANFAAGLTTASGGIQNFTNANLTEKSHGIDFSYDGLVAVFAILFGTSVLNFFMSSLAFYFGLIAFRDLGNEIQRMQSERSNAPTLSFVPQ